MSASTQLARVIVRQIIEAGITDAVISPGSRNAPLTLALFAAEEKGFIKLHVRIDERSAAFFALGITKATKRPVPVICTSGTAVANFHPAVLEASHSNLPLFVITADRPAELRRTGANQTTEQARIFGKAVRYFADVSGPAFPLELPLNALQSGPVHLNIQFDEPLIGDSDSSWLNAVKITPPKVFDRKKPGTLRPKSNRGVLVIGHDRAGFSVDEISEFAEKLGWPVISEDPLSFEGAIAHASIFLTSKTNLKVLTPDTAIVVGRTTLSRSINSLISMAYKTIVIDPRMATVDSDRMADQRFTALPEIDVAPVDPDWVAKWQKFSDRAAKVIGEINDWSEQLIAREIGARIPVGTSLYLSSSRPIRDIEGFATSRNGVDTFANRGLAGIDGNISTALGIAANREKTIAILGDLSFLHDLTGLVNKEAINLKIYVINNDGGGIFSTLPARGAHGFERVFGTPHGMDLVSIASALGVKAKKISNLSELHQELTEPINEISVIEIEVPGREANADFLKILYAKMDSL